MVKKDKKVEKIVEEAKEEGVKVEVVSEPKPSPAPKQKTCGHGNTDFCKFCGPL
jgi:peptide subunit release factor 1 (eRF1)